MAIFSSEKMTPHDLSTPSSPAVDPEEVRLRKMSRRAKVIQELVQTEKDYLTDLELCIREVVQPLRNLQVDAFKDPHGSLLNFKPGDKSTYIHTYTIPSGQTISA